MDTQTYFRIAGDFDPELITEALEMKPQKAHKKGEKQAMGKGRYPSSSWSAGYIESRNEIDIGQLMLKTIAVFKDKIEALKTIKELFDVRFYLEVVPKFESKNDKPIISPPMEVIEFCYLTGTEIDYDYYFYM